MILSPKNNLSRSYFRRWKARSCLQKIKTKKPCSAERQRNRVKYSEKESDVQNEVRRFGPGGELHDSAPLLGINNSFPHGPVMKQYGVSECAVAEAFRW